MIHKILHIPHSSNFIPNEFLSDYSITIDELHNECVIMNDTHTSELVYGILDSDIDIVKFEYSRVFCDVERFRGDGEIMNKIGMGILYENSHLLKPIRNVSSENKEKIFEIYDTYHNNLNNLVKERLETNDNILLIDIHSYSDIPLEYELFKELKRPDICIGIDYYHMNEKLLNDILYIVSISGFSYCINEPFKGCLIPSDYYGVDNRVNGFMFEINKKTLEKNFLKIKELLICLTKI
jgi:N-formylglutamate deformylase